MTRLPIVFLLLGLVACSSSGEGQPLSEPTGPPSIEPAAVARHAEQFDDDLPQRPAGSQHEFAAASYITAHLQSAGYLVELDAVPVEDLVRSSNVVALPPSGPPPQIVVALGYDTTPKTERIGRAIGTFLELARALRVAVPEHPVQFVALGAEHTALDGGSLGSRRLIRLLQEAEAEPEIVHIVATAGETTFEKAGFDTRVVDAGDDDLGPRLLDYLVDASR
ncbi:MAG: hypothetical protein ACRDKT_12345 [Actinomycetota bacterium]